MKFYVIEKQEKFKKFTDSQLVSEIDKEYILDIKKSSAKRKVFSRMDLKKSVRSTYLVLLLSLIGHIIALTVIFNIEYDSDGLVTLGIVISLSAIVHTLIIISLPFWFKKALIFDLEKNLIQTTTLVGKKTTRINITNIYRIVQNIDKQYSYYTFRERKNDFVPEKSPILAIKSEDSETKEILNTFLQDSLPKISLEKIENTKPSKENV